MLIYDRYEILAPIILTTTTCQLLAEVSRYACMSGCIHPAPGAIGSLASAQRSRKTEAAIHAPSIVKRRLIVLPGPPGAARTGGALGVVGRAA